MIRIAHRNDDGVFAKDIGTERLSDLLSAANEGHGMLWVEMSEPANDESGQRQLAEIDHILRSVFQFHPLAVDDALTESHIPKVDDWTDYLYIVVHDVAFNAALDDIDTRELDVFLGKHYLVTYHHEPIPALEREWNNLSQDTRHFRAGPDYLFYRICDGIATDYMPCMDAIDDVVDEIQDEVLDNPAPRLVHRVLRLKRAVLNIRRILSPQREVLNKLARDSYEVVDAREQVFFRDVYDHFVRLVNLNESTRDIIAGALDTYLSVTANRTNDVMKVLAIVTTLFMPISFLTGYFGMNFFGALTEVNHGINPTLLFVLVTAAIVCIPLAMVMYIRRQGWW